jgi:cytochrome c oxidase subunit 1
MAAVFGLFAATYYWFPLFNGRLMNERLGRWHFWLTLVPAYLTFFPMHFAGMAGEPRHFSQLTGSFGPFAHLIPLHHWISAWAFVLAATQALFLVNVVRSLRYGRAAGSNPWAATTLEWFQLALGERPVVHCLSDEYGVRNAGRDFRGQWEPPPEQE